MSGGRPFPPPLEKNSLPSFVEFTRLPTAPLTLSPTDGSEARGGQPCLETRGQEEEREGVLSTKVHFECYSAALHLVSVPYFPLTVPTKGLERPRAPLSPSSHLYFLPSPRSSPCHPSGPAEPGKAAAVFPARPC